MNERTPSPVEPLNKALEHVRLREGAIYLHAEYTEPSAVRRLG